MNSHIFMYIFLCIYLIYIAVAGAGPNGSLPRALSYGPTPSSGPEWAWALLEGPPPPGRVLYLKLGTRHAKTRDMRHAKMDT